MDEYLKWRCGYLEQYAHQQQLHILQDCQTFLWTENPTNKHTFWWNQPIAAPIQTTDANTEEIDWYTNMARQNALPLIPCAFFPLSPRVFFSVQQGTYCLYPSFPSLFLSFSFLISFQNRSPNLIFIVIITTYLGSQNLGRVTRKCRACSRDGPVAGPHEHYREPVTHTHAHTGNP
jgi:hypothetical protein